MDEALTIEVRHDHDHAIVTAAGEIDISTVTRLWGQGWAGRARGRARVFPGAMRGPGG